MHVCSGFKGDSWIFLVGVSSLHFIVIVQAAIGSFLLEGSPKKFENLIGCHGLHLKPPGAIFFDKHHKIKRKQTNKYSYFNKLILA